MAADRLTHLHASAEQLYQVSAWSDDPGHTLIVSGSMSLVFGQAAAERFEASLARKSLPYSSLRTFRRHRLPAAPTPHRLESES